METKKRFIFIRVILWATIGLLVFGYGVFIVINNRLTVTYQPYVADHVAVVLNNQDDTLDNVGFLLSDVQQLQSSSQQVAVVGDIPLNKDANIAKVVHNSNSLYINLFNNAHIDDSLISVFNNVYNIPGSLALKSYIAENENVQIVYDPASQVVQFVLQGVPFNINGDTLSTADIVVYRIEQVPGDYLLQVGDITISLAMYENNFSTSIQQLVSSPVRLYRLQEQNILQSQNASFEEGEWSSPVGDCSAYLPGNPQLSMHLVSDATDGTQAIQLSSKNHFACTLKDFDVSLNPAYFYKLSFDYKNVTGNTLQYYYSFKNSLDQFEEYFGSLESFDTDWHRFEQIIEYKLDAIDQMSVYLYAPSDGTAPVTNIYDNVQFSSFVLDREITVDQRSVFTTHELGHDVVLKSGENTFKAFRQEQNLLADYNYSFEQGLWQYSASDCSDYLDGEPEFVVRWDNRSIEGAHSLFISSTNHFACVSEVFPVTLESDKLYKLIFDYKSIVGNQSQYYYNLKNSYGHVQEQYDSVENYEPGWHGLETIIDPAIVDVQSMELIFYAPSDGSKEVTTLYDNVRLQEFAPKAIYSYYLFLTDAQKPKNTATVTEYYTANQWRSQLRVENITAPFMLVYPKSFDDKLQLVVGTEYEVSSDFHFSLNNNQNGWWVSPLDICQSSDSCVQNEDGSYSMELTIKHSHDSWFRYGVLFLGIIIFMLAILSYVAKGQKTTQ